jgi:hypothetical protein
VLFCFSFGLENISAITNIDGIICEASTGTGNQTTSTGTGTTSTGTTSSSVAQATGNNNSDPVRWWPSGTAQNWGIIGAALAAYRLVPGSPRVKTTAALSTLGVTIPMTVFTTAVVYPNGFNKLVFNWIEYNKTGSWGAVPDTVGDEVVQNKFASASNTAVTDYEKNLPANLKDQSPNIDPTKLAGKDLDVTEYFNNLSPYSLFNSLLSLFRLENLDGYFDELYGFIWFTQVLLFIISISLFILTIMYICINILLLNKDKIVSKLNPQNKFLKFYLNYQIVLGYISFYVLPILILTGLIEMIYILNYLITHPLPIQELNMDTHIYISKSKSN